MRVTVTRCLTTAAQPRKSLLGGMVFKKYIINKAYRWVYVVRTYAAQAP